MTTNPTPPGKPITGELIALSPDDAIALAIARGLSRRAAAGAANVSLSTVQRRVSDPEFQRRVAELRRELLQRSVGVLIDASRTAARTLKQLCKTGSNDFVRFAAARTILELAGLNQRAIEAEQTQSRIEALERLLKRRPK